MEKPVIFSDLEAVEACLVINTNQLKQCHIDHRFLTEKINSSKQRNNELFTKLGQIQAQIKHCNDVIVFMQELMVKLEGGESLIPAPKAA